MATASPRAPCWRGSTARASKPGSPRAEAALLSAEAAAARAMVNRPRIILADKPTAAPDSERPRVVMDLLRQVAREQEAAILVVTHDETIFDRCDRMVSLRDGRIEDGAAARRR